MARKIEVEILGDSKSLERAFLRSSKAGKDFQVSMGTIAKGAVVFSAVERGLESLGSVVRAGASEFSEAAKTGAQTRAVIKSTGNVANVSAKAVANLAGNLSSLSGIDDELIQKGSNLLLTFKNVRNELGKGNQIFNRATKDAVNLSVAGFGSIETTSKQLGKALNDPIKGMTALGRAGVTFSESQKKQISALVASNRLLDAQKIILREVESQVGGSAKALGETLPGQLNKLKETTKNILGDLVSQVAKPLASALGDVNEFFGKLGEKRSVRAKLEFVFDSLTGLAKELRDQIGEAVSRIDWTAVFRRASGIAEGLQARLAEVDFSVVGKRIGEAFSDAARVALPAAKDLASRLSDAVGEIDFEELGKAMGPGLAAAVATAFVTLLDPTFWVRNWELALSIALVAFSGPIGRFAGKAAGLLVDSLAVAIGRFAPRLAEAFRGLALQSVRLLGAGFALAGKVVEKVLGSLIGKVSAFFSRLGRIATFTAKVLGVEAIISLIKSMVSDVKGLFSDLAGFVQGVFRSVIESVIRFVQKILSVTSFLGRFDPFKGLRAKLNAQLEAMLTDSKTATDGIQANIDSLHGKTVSVVIQTTTTIGGEGPGRGETAAKAGAPSKVAKRIVTTIDQAVEAFKSGAESAVRKGRAKVEAAKKAFPGLIESMNLELDEATATKGFADDARVLAKIEAAILEEMRIEGNTTDLAKQLFDVRQKRAALVVSKAQAGRDAFSSLIEGIGLKVDAAAKTKGFADDRKRNDELQAAIRAEIAKEGKTTALARQLFDARQARAEIEKNARDAQKAELQKRQFRGLGLTGAGEKPTPTIANLQKQLGSLETNVKGTFLDTGKTSSLFDRVRKVLAGGLGKATEETRDKIRELFEAIRQELQAGGKKVSGDVTKTSALDTSKIVQGLVGNGISGDAARELRARLSKFNTGGVALAGGTGFGSSAPIVAGGAVPSAGDVINVYIDGQMVEATVTRRQQKRVRRNGAQARGTRAGRGI